MALKTVAYLMTGSVGLLSDAMESIVNLVGGVMALGMLTVAARPADDNHHFGHGKAEYFSSALEGSLIPIAAVAIAITAVPRLIHPVPLERVGIGLAVSTAAAAVNLGAALVLLRAGREHRSVTLQASGHHLLTDVWTSAGVLLGVGAVSLTGWTRLDPLIALAVAANIVWAGFTIVRTAVLGLTDAALPEDQLARVRAVLEAHQREGVQFHALRTRQAGVRSFVEMHVLVPGEWTVKQGHDLAERIELEVRAAVPGATVLTHLEPVEDPVSFADQGLDRQ
jgi:cation diffusion facilitator family transporter